ncbi:hypothetical protein ASC80_21380 [Afipia sp. Root123D2]|nr:hypothetical protein ASC80_21380 [Afipia sp. Root123D2]
MRQIETFEIELHPAGFDLRHVEDVVDDLQQVVSAGQDVVAVFLIFFRAERTEHAATHHFRETDDGVERRTQLVAHVGEELGLGLIGFLGPLFFLGILLRQISEFAGLPLERRLRAFEIDDTGGQPHVVFDQLLFVKLDLGDVGADGDVAAVLGAPLADMEPAPVVKLSLEGAGARRPGDGFGQPRTDFRHPPDFDHRLIGRTRHHC